MNELFINERGIPTDLTVIAIIVLGLLILLFGGQRNGSRTSEPNGAPRPSLWESFKAGMASAWYGMRNGKGKKLDKVGTLEEQAVPRAFAHKPAALTYEEKQELLAKAFLAYEKIGEGGESPKWIRQALQLGGDASDYRYDYQDFLLFIKRSPTFTPAIKVDEGYPEIARRLRELNVLGKLPKPTTLSPKLGAEHGDTPVKDLLNPEVYWLVPMNEETAKSAWTRFSYDCEHGSNPARFTHKWIEQAVNDGRSWETMKPELAEYGRWLVKNIDDLGRQVARGSFEEEAYRQLMSAVFGVQSKASAAEAPASAEPPVLPAAEPTAEATAPIELDLTTEWQKFRKISATTAGGFEAQLRKPEDDRKPGPITTALNAFRQYLTDIGRTDVPEGNDELRAAIKLAEQSQTD